MGFKENMNFDYFYVARQPIFDRQGNTYGYELLFRTGEDKSVAEINDGDFATMCVATCGFSKSQEAIDQSKRIFINFTENLILQGAPRALPPAVTVVEVLEDTIPSPQVKEEIIKLKQDGFFIAIDDFEGTHIQNELLDVADIIKVDVLDKSTKYIQDIFHKIESKKALKIAEKVNNNKVYSIVREIGFDFFQGFFFAKPENFKGKKLVSTQTSKLRILAGLNDPSVGIDEIVHLISADPSIIYCLLRLMNSAAFGFSMKIESVRHAVTLLGIRRVKYWLRMVVLSDLTPPDKPQELFVMALNRGRLMEKLTIEGAISAKSPENMFLFGMLSLVDVMLDLPFVKIIDKLPLADNIKNAYLDKNSDLALFLSLFIAIETADTAKFRQVCQLLHLQECDVADASIRAQTWTNIISSSLPR